LIATASVFFLFYWILLPGVKCYPLLVTGQFPCSDSLIYRFSGGIINKSTQSSKKGALTSMHTVSKNWTRRPGDNSCQIL